MEYYESKPNRTTIICRIALAFCILAFLLNIIGYATPYWIVAKREVRERRKFDRLGLWEACFNQYRPDTAFYGETYDGCHWTLSQYYKSARSWLNPDWFIAVQVLGTFTLLCIFISCSMLLVYFVGGCKPGHEHPTLLAASAILILSGIIETVVVALFGIKGDDRNWLPRPDINYYSWSYAFCVASAFFALFSGILMVVEAMQVSRRQASAGRAMRMEEMRGMR